MSSKKARAICVAMAASIWPVNTALAAEIIAPANESVNAAFDITETRIEINQGQAVFSTRVRGSAGAAIPKTLGRFEGSEVFAYVWPTSLNSADVGFENGQGIVALAATFHPDFDDAAKGAKNRDRWHAHWVVLNEDKACPGGLKVKDIPAGAKPRLPANWPGAPILIDSPAYETEIAGSIAVIRVPLADIGALASASYDGVTAGLKINADLHAPLLCVQNVFKIASGDLSLPGKITQAD